MFCEDSGRIEALIASILARISAQNETISTTPQQPYCVLAVGDQEYDTLCVNHVSVLVVSSTPCTLPGAAGACEECGEVIAWVSSGGVLCPNCGRELKESSIIRTIRNGVELQISIGSPDLKKVIAPVQVLSLLPLGSQCTLWVTGCSVVGVQLGPSIPEAQRLTTTLREVATREPRLESLLRLPHCDPAEVLESWCAQVVNIPQSEPLLRAALLVSLVSQSPLSLLVIAQNVSS